MAVNTVHHRPFHAPVYLSISPFLTERTLERIVMASWPHGTSSCRAHQLMARRRRVSGSDRIRMHPERIDDALRAGATTTCAFLRRCSETIVGARRTRFLKSEYERVSNRERRSISDVEERLGYHVGQLGR